METQMQFVSVADLLDRRAVCQFFGGTKPLNPATLYRGIRKGRYPILLLRHFRREFAKPVNTTQRGGGDIFLSL
jgi:hypothetical protein